MRILGSQNMTIVVILAFLSFAVALSASPLHEKVRLAIRQPPPAEPSSSSDEDETMLTNYVDYFTCNEAWYGHPIVHDCFNAIQQFPDFLVDGDIYREFLGIIGPSAPHLAPGLDGPPIQTPLVKTFGK